jgi:hypothetical protein
MVAHCKMINVQIMKSIKRVIYTGLIVFFSMGSFAQEQPFRYAVYAELFGNGVLYTVNLERSLSKMITGRAGIGVAPKSVGIPVMAGRIFGKGKHHLEFMMGVSYLYSGPREEIVVTENNLFGTSFIGYRFQDPQKRFLLKLGYTPLIRLSEPEAGLYYHWGGIGVGWRF